MRLLNGPKGEDLDLLTCFFVGQYLADDEGLGKAGIAFANVSDLARAAGVNGAQDSLL
jgi:hypothetical protein